MHKQGEYSKIDSSYDSKIDLNLLTNDISEKKKEQSVNILNERKKLGTNIVNDYLKIVDKKYISDKIVDNLSVDNDIITLKIEEYSDDIDRDFILSTPLKNLNIYHDKLIKIDFDHNLSIFQMIKQIIPGNSKLYGMVSFKEKFNTPVCCWGNSSQYEIVIKFDGCCNDPLCLFLCCYNKKGLYLFEVFCSAYCCCPYIRGCCGP